MMVSNDVTAPGAGFEHDTNSVTIIVSGDASVKVVEGTKSTVAHAVLDTVKRIRAGHQGKDQESSPPEPRRHE